MKPEGRGQRTAAVGGRMLSFVDRPTFHVNQHARSFFKTGRKGGDRSCGNGELLRVGLEQTSRRGILVSVGLPAEAATVDLWRHSSPHRLTFGSTPLPWSGTGEADTWFPPDWGFA